MSERDEKWGSNFDTRIDDYARAASGSKNFPESFNWIDKPHRLVYDLARVAKTEHTARLEAEAQRDALAEKVAQTERPCWGCDSPLVKCYDARKSGLVSCCPECRHDATLSDNQENPALTDKEA